MFKPYFTYKGRRMGWHNTIDNRKKKEEFMWWRLWRAIVFVTILMGLNGSAYKVYTLTQSPVWLFIAIALCAIWLTYAICFVLHGSKVKYKFCSTSKEEAEQFVIEMCATHKLPLNSHGVVLEDGWYMVFIKHKEGR